MRALELRPCSRTTGRAPDPSLQSRTCKVTPSPGTVRSVGVAGRVRCIGRLCYDRSLLQLASVDQGGALGTAVADVEAEHRAGAELRVPVQQPGLREVQRDEFAMADGDHRAPRMLPRAC